MQRWILALDEPASDPCGSQSASTIKRGYAIQKTNGTPNLHVSELASCTQGMLERGKFCSSGAIATALAVPGGNQIGSSTSGSSPDADGVKLSLHLPSERYASCNNAESNLYAVPRTELHEIDWIDPDSLDGEVSRLVAGCTARIASVPNNPRRCCRTSTSSGYSSHSPPLSAASYSCYAGAAAAAGAGALPPGQGAGSLRVAPCPMRDQFAAGLAVIHEGEAIPRPIWPSASAFPSPRDLYHTDDANPEYDALHGCCGCSCAYAYSSADWEYNNPGNSARSARDVLLELSRTLNSVIDGETAMTPEEILQNISRTVAQGIGLRGGIYECIYQNPTLLSKKSSSFSTKSSTLNDKGSSTLSAGVRSSSRVNPVNSKLYGGSRHLYKHNPTWSKCNCEHARKPASTTKTEDAAGEQLGGKESGPPAVFLVRDHRHQAPRSKSRGAKLGAGCTCRCWSRPNNCAKGKSIYEGRQIGADPKEAIGFADSKQKRNALNPGEPEYTTLEPSDGSSSSEGIVPPAGKARQWEHRLGGFTEELDFTLDVSRAERLGRAIAKAKRKRQWCRALTAFFGLVFFVLSVVIVSLSVTRGRKVFGSM